MSRSRTALFAGTALTLTLTLALVGLGTWSSLDDTPSTSTQVSVETTEDTRRRTTRTARSGGAATPDGDAGIAQLDRDLTVWRDLFSPKGRLSVEETRALIAERDAAAEALAGTIGGLSADQLDEVLVRFDASKTRDKIVLIDGLGRNVDGEAVALLEELYEAEEGYTLRAKVLTALGDSAAPAHTHLLVEQMWSAQDERLSQTAAMMLRGEAAATSDLAAAMDSDLPMNTRLEAVSSLGAVGSSEAEQALQEVVDGDDTHPRLKAYAEKELERSFG